MSPHLFVSDLDRTLLQPEGLLSSRARSLLTRMLGEGLAFTVASARSIHSIRPILTDLPLTLPVIEFNGAFLTDMATTQHQVINAIDAEDLVILHSIAQNAGLVPYVATFDGERDNLYCPDPANPAMVYYNDDRRSHGDPRVREMVSLERSLDEQVVSFTFIGEKRRLLSTSESLSAAGLVLAINLFENPYSPGWYWLTAAHPAANKAAAIETLVERHGLMDHRIVAFGDEINDLPMLKAADVGVAVANAIPAVLEAADTVIGPNTDDAVVGYIASLFDG